MNYKYTHNTSDSQKTCSPRMLITTSTYSLLPFA